MRSKQLHRQALQHVIHALRIEAIAAEVQASHAQRKVCAHRASDVWASSTPKPLRDEVFEAIQAEFNVLRRLSVAEAMLEEMTHV